MDSGGHNLRSELIISQSRTAEWNVGFATERYPIVTCTHTVRDKYTPIDWKPLHQLSKWIDHVNYSPAIPATGRGYKYPSATSFDLSAGDVETRREMGWTSCAFTHWDDYGEHLIKGTVPVAAVNVKSSFVTHSMGLVEEGGGTSRSFYIFGTGYQTTVVRRETVHHQVVLMLFSPFSEHP